MLGIIGICLGALLIVVYLLFSNPGKRQDYLSKSKPKGINTKLFNASVKSAEHTEDDVFKALCNTESTFLGGRNQQS